MKVFLDANILISVLNKEYPTYTHAVRILSLNSSKYHFVTTNVALAIAFYFAEKKHGRTLAKSKIGIIMRSMHIIDCGEKETTFAVSDKRVHDFEDGLQYYAALHANCNCIVTNDVEDFYFSEVRVLDAEHFFRKYV